MTEGTGQDQHGDTKTRRCQLIWSNCAIGDLRAGHSPALSQTHNTQIKTAPEQSAALICVLCVCYAAPPRQVASRRTPESAGCM